MKQSMLLVFALLATVGNALFAMGQKKATVSNSLLFIGCSALVCVVMIFILIPIIGGDNPKVSTLIKTNWKWILLCGFGLCLTYIGFNLLYRNFGATSYVYYAVLSIITTSVIVGIIIFREKINIYHILSIVAALTAIVLFSIGNKIGH